MRETSSRRQPLETTAPLTSGGTPWVVVSAAFVKTGGQDRANYALASYLAQHGHDVHLVAHRVDPDLERLARVVHHAVPRPLRSDLLGEPFLRRRGVRCAEQLHLRSPRVVVNGGNCEWSDVNWVHYVHAAYDRAREGGLLRRTRLQLSHARWLADERRSLGRARLVIANSRKTMRDLTERVGVPAERIRVVYYGIDPDQFRPPRPGERDATRAVLGWPGARPVVLFVGALGDRRKGFDTLFGAWASLPRKTSFDPLLVVIGHGALLAEWRRRVASAGLKDSISFLGFRDDVPRIMRAADALVSPTRYEAYGLGVHEALCCGVPAIVSADAGVAEQYPAALGSLLLPDAEDPADLARRVETCLAEVTRDRLALDGFAARLRSRTWDDMAADIVGASCEP